MNRALIIVLALAMAVVLWLTISCASLERKLLYYPTHRPADGILMPWTKNGALIGYARKVESPKNVWLMLHGNGGQAADRRYALSSFSAEDAVYILEYPGYGDREGVPSKESLNQAAKEAYLLLRDTYPKTPVCVVGESIGSGPAASLAGINHPPEKMVFIVPFDKLSLVAKDHFPSIIVSLILMDNWDNLAALSNYKGPVDIFGAAADSIIPVEHAKALAAGVPSSKFVLIEGGHNDWPQQDRVKIRNP